jgi:phosphonate transport system substrate-binding protein
MQKHMKADSHIKKHTKIMLRKSLGKSLAGAVLASLLLSVAGCDRLLSPTSAEVGDAIILTDVDFDPDSLIPETQPVADYLSKHLQKAGISQGEVKIAPDVETVGSWMISGDVNLYFDSVYPVMRVMEHAGGTPILRRWKDGVAEYSTYFVVQRDRDLNDIQDLQGEMITLQEPSSSSGFMFPMGYLLKRGFNPVEKAEVNHAVAKNEVGYVFSGQEEVTIEWVLEGRVVAGAVDSETWAELPKETREQLKIIAETEKFPRHVVLAGPRLSDEQVDALKTALLDMDESRQGREALAVFSETAKFDEFPEGADKAISQLQDTYHQIKLHVAQQR